MDYFHFHFSCAGLSILLQVSLLYRLNNAPSTIAFKNLFEAINEILKPKGLCLSMEHGGVLSHTLQQKIKFPNFPVISYSEGLKIGFFIQSLILGPLQVLILLLGHIAMKSGSSTEVSLVSKMQEEQFLLISRLKNFINSQNVLTHEIADIINDICGNRTIGTDDLYWDFMDKHFIQLEEQDSRLA